MNTLRRDDESIPLRMTTTKGAIVGVGVAAAGFLIRVVLMGTVGGPELLLMQLLRLFRLSSLSESVAVGITVLIICEVVVSGVISGLGGYFMRETSKVGA